MKPVGEAVAYFLIALLALAVGWWALGWMGLFALIGSCFVANTLLQLLLWVTSNQQWGEDSIKLVWYSAWLFAGVVVGMMTIRRVILALWGESFFH